MKKIFILLAVVLLMAIVGCSSDKAITSFSFANPPAEGVISESTRSIVVTVPFGTDVTGLIPTITHTGDTISPPSGVPQDFTEPVTYTVTAEDTTKRDYKVTVVKEAALSAKSITAFSISGVAGTINETEKTIAVTVPFGIDLTELIPTITHTGDTISPASGKVHDFTKPVIYTVTAEDDTTQDYIITVTVAEN